MIKYEVRVHDDGYKEWWLNNQLHREDGPAVEKTNGYKAWYLNGKCHREDGPAIEWIDGYKEWWLNGKQVTEEDVIGHTIGIDGMTISINNESYEKFRNSMLTP